MAQVSFTITQKAELVRRGIVDISDDVALANAAGLRKAVERAIGEGRGIVTDNVVEVRRGEFVKSSLTIVPAQDFTVVDSDGEITHVVACTAEDARATFHRSCRGQVVTILHGKCEAAT